ncbi:hypothetical protein NAEGRDRAFT_49873 [Naegleria gruberi]|uniref:Actin n=1 Tax=Naegleria gruberi TaxID=5762 RepID=D2VIR3_NAEGR|nr:uncharacterized protein NAEGRDRAFT_49873 [Naegleria gruberi]EFC43396.1 hypothetical protein NAEGRDRAFT_49873 [Naegleria gruberi]|eukprot:XP_002676140.1 hypothetical protein NAEGRDRAFT_49873 [Naegleria gruberi strain NEG-M]
MTELDRAICMDIGFGNIRAGFVCRDAPRAVFPPYIGRPKIKGMIIPGMKNVFVGDEAVIKKAILKLSKPMDRDVITNWDDMEILFEHVFFNELRVEPENQGIILGEGCFNPKQNRRKLAEMLFEKFKVPLMNSCPNALLVLISSGRSSGVVLDCGEGTSSSVPIYEGCIIRNGVRRMDLAGNELTDHMDKLLKDSGNTFRDRSLVTDIKEKTCRVALDFERELNEECSGKNYELPDGNNLCIRSECIKCPEIMFQPSMIGMDLDGVHKMVIDSINSNTDAKMKNKFFENIILSGGSTMFDGFSERILKELNQLAFDNKVKVVAPPERKYSAWIGANILGSLSTFESTWIRSEEYAEYGSGIINRKTCY